MDKTISLLRFIESEKNGFLLEIPVINQGKIPGHSGSSSFQIIDSGQNFSIVIKAGIKTRQSEVFKPLFLLIQRDHYPLLPDVLNPITNADLDKIWNETIQFYSTDKGAFTIPSQDFNEGKPTQFAPLFFCKKKTKFFHPPCPQCGEPLDLCRDDRCLKDAGLIPYSTSLRRYLVCHRCQSPGRNQIFYQFSRFPEDLVLVKDRFDLVKDFNKLRTTPSGNFPCLDCPEHSACHITGEKAASRIEFFSFYPFHMVLFDAASIKAVDFIPFLSGKSFQDLPSPSRIDSGGTIERLVAQLGGDSFFFEDEDRFFLEILYLKLCLLEKIASGVNQRVENDIASGMGLSASSIWITPIFQGGMLPFFWNFKISIIGLVSNTSTTPIDFSLTGSRNLNFMVCLWFYTLLVNKNQGPEAVYQQIETLCEHSSPERDLAHYDTISKDLPALALENIFWNPHAVLAPEKWKHLWSKALLTGVEFLKEGHPKQLKSGLTNLIAQVKNLKQEIMQDLFFSRSMGGAVDHGEAISSSAETTAVKIKFQDDQQAITRILKQLETKWIKESASLEDADGDILETIVLASPKEQQTQTALNEPAIVFSGSETAPDSVSDFEEMEKTRVLTGAKIEPDHNSDFETMDETRIISPQETPRSTTHFFEEDDLDKTMIIPPKTRR
jgi:hypothetical protein